MNDTSPEKQSILLDRNIFWWQVKIDTDLIKKYNKPVPRYTSYPTAPEWSDEINESNYQRALEVLSCNEDEGIALYIHLPFCKSLCNYCGCHVFIRSSEEKAEPYLLNLKEEIRMVASCFKTTREIKQLHFGGGSPSFINEKQFNDLVRHLFKYFRVSEDAELAIEADPRTVSKAKLKGYRSLGFNRMSFGVQDLDPLVQEAINRIQPVEMIEKLMKDVRDLGFKSVNLDLIYGLPRQTTERFSKTIKKVIALNPDRIALFGYAHIPWIKRHQNKMNTNDIPEADDKLAIFLRARDLLLDAGYVAIGMDHFAKPSDALYTAYQEKRLYRNFMGYTVEDIPNILGFGVSSIGKIGNAFFQNSKTLKEYDQYIRNSVLPIDRGLVLTKDDVVRQQMILALMCQFEVDKTAFGNRFSIDVNNYFEIELNELDALIGDHLVEHTNTHIKVTDTGRLFVRNIATIFDIYYRSQQIKRRFSKSV